MIHQLRLACTCWLVHVYGNMAIVLTMIAMAYCGWPYSWYVWVPRVSKLFAVDEPLEIFCVHGDEPKRADSPSASCELGVLRRT